MLSFWRARLFVLTALLALCCSMAPVWAMVCDCAPKPAMVCERPCGSCCHRYPVPPSLEQNFPVVLRAPAIRAAQPAVQTVAVCTLPPVPSIPQVQLPAASVSYPETETRPPRTRLGPTLACRAPPVPL